MLRNMIILLLTLGLFATNLSASPLLSACLSDARKCAIHQSEKSLDTGGSGNLITPPKLSNSNVAAVPTKPSAQKESSSSAVTVVSSPKQSTVSVSASS